ncbi:MAG: hypothetical protein HKP30_16365 [Myxococcales bacterium]|nr:hypothetical protein [Myxococcales bacterium]
MAIAQGRRDEREYFRVQTELPLRLKPIGESERDSLAQTILQRDTVETGDIDPHLARWLDRLESKLDHVLTHLGLDVEGMRPTERLPVVLSGSGMLLSAIDSCRDADWFLLDFELPGTPDHPVRALAERVHNGPRGEVLALRFTAITPEDRNAVVRYTLDVERKHLRHRTERRAEA